MKTILCYGDSNTYGLVPGSIDFKTGYRERFAYHERWTGLLQLQLGDQYRVIEEGLCARTTILDYSADQYKGDRNGKHFIEPALMTHSPVDWVILFLGVNDCKAQFQQSTKNISENIEALLKLILSLRYGPNMQTAPKVLVLAFPPITEKPDEIFKGAHEKSQALPALLAAVCNKQAVSFLDLSKIVTFSDVDGCHFDKPGHFTVANSVYKKLLSLLK